MTVLSSHSPGLTGGADDTSAEPAVLTLRQRGVLWAPWLLLLAASGAALAAVAWFSIDLFAARQALAERDAALAAAESPGAVGEAGWVDAQAGALALEDAVTQLVFEPSHLLEQVEALAAEVGVSLLQFVPEAHATATVAPALASVRLQLRGAEEAVLVFLDGLVGRAPAAEMTTLRLAGAGGLVLCDLALRLHDEAALAGLGEASPLPRTAAGRILDGLPERTPGGLFASNDDPVDEGAATASRREAASTSHPPPPDPLAGTRLSGILQSAGRSAALLELSGAGPMLLRPADRLGATPFRIDSVAPGRIIVIGASGERRVLELAPAEAVAP